MTQPDEPAAKLPPELEALMSQALFGALTEMPWPMWTARARAGESCSLWTNAALDSLIRSGDPVRAEAELKAFTAAVAGGATTDATLLMGTTRFRPGLHAQTGADGSWCAVGWLVPLASAHVRAPGELLENLTDRTLVFDQKTGLTVRATTDRELRAEISRSRRYGNALSVLIAEVYPQTDAARELALDALTLLARTLKENLRWVDVLGAWDAETIVVILPETGHAAAEALLEKLASPVSVVSEVFPGFDFHLGFCEWADGMMPDQMVAGARASARSLKKSSG